MPETEIRHLMKYLGESIHEILADSPKIHEHIQKIREAGYEVFLVIEAKADLGDKKKEDDEIAVADEPVRLRITQDDVKFLQSLKISSE